MKSRKRAPGLINQPVATIRGAQGFRVQLKNGLMRTKDRTTSVPTTHPHSTTRSPRFIPLRVGSAGVRLYGEPQYVAAGRAVKKEIRLRSG